MTGTGTRTVNFRGNQAEQDVPQMTADATGLTGTSPSDGRDGDLAGQGVNIPAEAGLFNAPHVDSRRGAQNTNDLRGKVLRITVKDGDITAAEENKFGGAYTVPAGNLFPAGTARRAPRSTRWASGTRSGSRWTRTTSPT